LERAIAVSLDLDGDAEIHIEAARTKAVWQQPST
jgi:hypothetical protein